MSISPFLLFLLTTAFATFALTTVDNPSSVDQLKALISHYVYLTTQMIKYHSSPDEASHWKITFRVSYDVADSARSVAYYASNKTSHDLIYRVNDEKFQKACNDIGTMLFEPVYFNKNVITFKLLCPIDKAAIQWTCLIIIVCCCILMICVRFYKTRPEKNVKPANKGYKYYVEPAGNNYV